MADIKISQLSEAASLEGVYTIGVDKYGLSKKVSLQKVHEVVSEFPNVQQDVEANRAGIGQLSQAMNEVREQIENNEVLIEDLQNTKIDKEADDYYPQLSVGTADNLAGVDEVARVINFGQSGGGAITDGVARVQSIKGNSVVWNNLTNGESMLVAESTKALPKGATFVEGHKYALYCDGLQGSLWLYTNVGSGGLVLASLKGVIGNIFTASVSIIASGGTSVAGGVWLYVSGSASQALNPKVCDLTKMFGAGNEPTTIAEFYQRIPMGVDMNAYNEGEVISMNAIGIKSVGRNQWDEQWELGAIDSNTGVETSNSSTIRPKNFIKVLPSCDYYIASQVNEWVLFYDEKKVFVDKYWAGSVKTFTTPANCHYLKFRLPSSYGTTYKNDICINLSDTDFNGQYEPYIEDSEDLLMVAKYFPNGMRSAESAYDEIRYNKATNRWERVIRIATNDMGSFSWSYQPKSDSYPHGFFYTNLNSDLTDMKHGAGVLCKLYSKGGVTDDKSMASNTSNNMIYVRDSAYSDVASFKAAMSGVMLYYERAEPFVTEIEEKDFNLDYKVWNCGTEQMEATEPSAPLAADITYGFNAVGLIKQLRSMIEALSAKVASL